MTYLNKIVAAAALAGGMLVAAPVSAITFAGQPTSDGPLFSWVRDADLQGGTLSALPNDGLLFRFSLPFRGTSAPGGFIPVALTFSATAPVAMTEVELGTGVQETQWFLDGEFSYVATEDGVGYEEGDVILAAEFEGARLVVGSITGSVNQELTFSGSSLSYSSDVFDFLTAVPGQDLVPLSFGFVLTGFSPTLSLDGDENTSPDSFTAVASGQFDVRAVPEPATWAMLIAGFGLVGTSMRRSRRIKTVLA